LLGSIETKTVDSGKKSCPQSNCQIVETSCTNALVDGDVLRWGRRCPSKKSRADVEVEVSIWARAIGLIGRHGTD
jgi:hypothetical protein